MERGQIDAFREGSVLEVVATLQAVAISLPQHSEKLRALLRAAGKVEHRLRVSAPRARAIFAANVLFGL